MFLRRISRLATVSFSAIVLFVGCSNQPSHFSNPLYSADRVPPPSTRTLAPGTGQPYYSGDPLPAIPSGQSSTITESPESPLNWNSPNRSNAMVQPAASVELR